MKYKYKTKNMWKFYQVIQLVKQLVSSNHSIALYVTHQNTETDHGHWSVMQGLTGPFFVNGSVVHCTSGYRIYWTAATTEQANHWTCSWPFLILPTGQVRWKLILEKRRLNCCAVDFDSALQKWEMHSMISRTVVAEVIRITSSLC